MVLIGSRWGRKRSWLDGKFKSWLGGIAFSSKRSNNLTVGLRIPRYHSFLDPAVASERKCDWGDVSGVSHTFSDSGHGSIGIVISRAPVDFRMSLHS